MGKNLSKRLPPPQISTTPTLPTQELALIPQEYQHTVYADNNDVDNTTTNNATVKQLIQDQDDVINDNFLSSFSSPSCQLDLLHPSFMIHHHKQSSQVATASKVSTSSSFTQTAEGKIEIIPKLPQQSYSEDSNLLQVIFPARRPHPQPHPSQLAEEAEIHHNNSSPSSESEMEEGHTHFEIPDPPLIAIPTMTAPESPSNRQPRPPPLFSPMPTRFNFPMSPITPVQFGRIKGHGSGDKLVVTSPQNTEQLGCGRGGGDIIDKPTMLRTNNDKTKSILNLNYCPGQGEVREMVVGMGATLSTKSKPEDKKLPISLNGAPAPLHPHPPSSHPSHHHPLHPTQPHPLENETRSVTYIKDDNHHHQNHQTTSDTENHKETPTTPTTKKKLVVRGLKKFVSSRGGHTHPPQWVRDFPIKSKYHVDNYICEESEKAEGVRRVTVPICSPTSSSTKRSGRCTTCGIYSVDTCRCCRKCQYDCGCPTLPKQMPDISQAFGGGWVQAQKVIAELAEGNMKGRCRDEVGDCMMTRDEKRVPIGRKQRPLRDNPPHLQSNIDVLNPSREYPPRQSHYQMEMQPHPHQPPPQGNFYPQQLSPLQYPPSYYPQPLGFYPPPPIPLPPMYYPSPPPPPFPYYPAQPPPPPNYHPYPVELPQNYYR